ncbi:hypothetical protein Droror1_Dr00025677 [Drosera rotundifolia]
MILSSEVFFVGFFRMILIIVLGCDVVGSLYYANATVGTTGLGYLVALDTGSNLLWLPCNCSSSVSGVITTSGKEIDFNIYSLNSSSTGTLISCNSFTCQSQYTGSCLRHITSVLTNLCICLLIRRLLDIW